MRTQTQRGKLTSYNYCVEELRFKPWLSDSRDCILKEMGFSELCHQSEFTQETETIPDILKEGLNMTNCNYILKN